MCKEINFENCKQPCDEVVKSFVAAFDIVYHKSEQDLEKFFKEPYLEKTSEEVISNRVNSLNALYSTRIEDNKRGKIIASLISKDNGAEFEKRVINGDLSAVAELADFCPGMNYFVFATKYCSFLSQYQFEKKEEKDKYPIFDSLVYKALLKFNSGDKRFYKDKLPGYDTIRKKKDYQTFKSIIDAFKKEFKLLDCSYREIDKFLWLVGKNIEDKKEAAVPHGEATQ